MDAYDWSTGVYATAVAMAKCMTTEELSRTAILLTQLGTTLGTLAALRHMEEGGTGAVTEFLRKAETRRGTFQVPRRAL